MASSLVARLAAVASASSLLIVGIVDAVDGRWWAALEIVAAAVILVIVAVEASGIVRVSRRGDR